MDKGETICPSPLRGGDIKYCRRSSESRTVLQRDMVKRECQSKGLNSAIMT